MKSIKKLVAIWVIAVTVLIVTSTSVGATACGESWLNWGKTNYPDDTNILVQEQWYCDGNITVSIGTSEGTFIKYDSVSNWSSDVYRQDGSYEVYYALIEHAGNYAVVNDNRQANIYVAPTPEPEPSTGGSTSSGTTDTGSTTSASSGTTSSTTGTGSSTSTGGSTEDNSSEEQPDNGREEEETGVQSEIKTELKASEGKMTFTLTNNDNETIRKASVGFIYATGNIDEVDFVTITTEDGQVSLPKITGAYKIVAMIELEDDSISEEVLGYVYFNADDESVSIITEDEYMNMALILNDLI
jgi:hypothetical protein